MVFPAQWYSMCKSSGVSPLCLLNSNQAKAKTLRPSRLLDEAKNQVSFLILLGFAMR